MRKVVLIAAVAAFVLALSAQAVASWAQAGPEQAIGTTTVHDRSVAEFRSLLEREPKVNFTADLAATNGDLELELSGTLTARVATPPGN